MFVSDMFSPISFWRDMVGADMPRVVGGDILLMDSMSFCVLGVILSLAGVVLPYSKNFPL
jgi:hypothetical protein